MQFARCCQAFKIRKFGKEVEGRSSAKGGLIKLTNLGKGMLGSAGGGESWLSNW